MRQRRFWVVVACLSVFAGCDSCDDDKAPAGEALPPAPPLEPLIMGPAPDLNGPMPKGNESEDLEPLLGHWRGVEARTSSGPVGGLAEAIAKVSSLDIDRRKIEFIVSTPEGKRSEIRPYIFRRKKGPRLKLHVWVKGTGREWVVDTTKGDRIEVFEVGNPTSFVYEKGEPVEGGVAADADAGDAAASDAAAADGAAPPASAAPPSGSQ